MKADTKYLLVKQDQHGRIYTVELCSDMDLVGHLHGTFSNTKHVVLSVLNLRPKLGQ